MFERPLNILVLTPWFPNSRDGWPGPFIADSCIALAAAGHNVRTVVFRGFVPPLAKRFAPLEHRGQIDIGSFPEVEALELSRYLALPKGFLRPAANWSLDRSIRRAFPKPSERAPDIVLIHTEGLAPGAVPVARALNIPSVIVLHGENTNQDYLFGPSQAQRFRGAISSANKLVMVGEPLRQHASRLGAANEQIEVIWNGVNPPDLMRSIPNPDTKKLRIITTSNLQKEKGVDLLISAMERLRHGGFENWYLTIIGDGPMRNELVHQVETAGLEDFIQFLGPISNTEVFEHLANSDIFVLPSYREAFGVAYLEAMATGLLAIGVQGQGPAQFIQHGKTGLLSEPRSVDSLIDLLKPLMHVPDRTKWRNIAARGAAFVRSEMSWNEHAQRMTTLMRNITLRG